jgi:STE24 endopeptidase
MNIYLVIILTVLVGSYVLNLIVESLNIRHLRTELPKEFEEYYDADKYKQAQNYLKENTGFEIITDTIFLAIILTFILLGGFNIVDQFARNFHLGLIPTGLIFAGVLLLTFQILHIPFSVYHTFVIEEKYGFNKTTVKIFILDILKSWLLATLIGGAAFSGILWFFGKAGSLAWLYCWVALILFQIFLVFIAPVVIMPLFNKFTPLEEGELRKAIEGYAKSQSFKMKGVFKMDGSRRSTKSNAFFIGFGKFKRIVLFDTLIEKHTVSELVSVLSHEIGHYKKKHIFKFMLISTITTGLMFFLLSLFINNQGLFLAFKVEEVSIYASLFFFGFLYAPINMVFSILTNVFSRKYEYEADAYVASTYRQPEAMITTLKKLSVDNLSNLTPHPLKVFLHYTHPPVLKRIQAIRKIG